MGTNTFNTMLVRQIHTHTVLFRPVNATRNLLLISLKKTIANRRSVMLDRRSNQPSKFRLVTKSFSG